MKLILQAMRQLRQRRLNAFYLQQNDLDQGDQDGIGAKGLEPGVHGYGRPPRTDAREMRRRLAELEYIDDDES